MSGHILEWVGPAPGGQTFYCTDCGKLVLDMPDDRMILRPGDPDVEHDVNPCWAVPDKEEDKVGEEHESGLTGVWLDAIEELQFHEV